MPLTNTLDFSTPAGADKSLKKISQLMGRAGQSVVVSEFNQKPKRSSDTTYRQAYLTLASGQQVTLRVNGTGDIYQVLINGSVAALKQQADTSKAVVEIAALVEKSQAAFQKAQARKLVALPKGMSTPKPKIAQALAAQVTQLDTQIAERKSTVADLQAQLGDAAMTDSAHTIVLPLASAYVAAREIARASGAMLDDARTAGAAEWLRIGLDTAKNNGPISLERGDLEQARLQMSIVSSFEAALSMLDSAGAGVDDRALAQLVAIAQADTLDEDGISDQAALASLLKQGLVEAAEGLYYATDKGRACLIDNGMDDRGEPLGD